MAIMAPFITKQLACRCQPVMAALYNVDRTAVLTDLGQLVDPLERSIRRSE